MAFVAAYLTQLHYGNPSPPRGGGTT
jgi:hypothetical protein